MGFRARPGDSQDGLNARLLSSVRVGRRKGKATYPPTLRLAHLYLTAIVLAL